MSDLAAPQPVTLRFDSSQGVSYVFVRSGTIWSQQQKLTASDGAAGDYFGWAVTLSADGQTSFISANAKNNGQGVTYVFNTTSTCNGVVTNTTDDGTASTSGTFSYALNQATSGQTICFNLNSGSTITFTGALTPTVPSGVTIDGSSNSTGEIILNGNSQSGDGLVLGGKDTLRKLTIQSFAGRELVVPTNKGGNILDHVKLIHTGS